MWARGMSIFFFFNDTATTEIYTLSLHDALPIFNELDLLLGVCRASDPYYAQLLVDKMLFMLPDDQARLRSCMTYRSLLDEFLAVADTSSDTDWFQENAAAFIEVCELFGQTAAQHHDLLVKRFIEEPAADLKPHHLAGVTATGPPFPPLIHPLAL